MVLTALAEGLDPSAAERVFGYRQATITTWLTRAGGHAEIFHERCFRNLRLPHVQLDELRTRLRRTKQVLWLWLAIDPLTKILPVTRARSSNATHGPSAHPLAAAEPGPWLPSAFHQRRAQSLLLCTDGPLRPVARGGSSRVQRAPVASGSRSDLRSGEEMLPKAEVGAGLAADASWHKGRPSGQLAGTGPLRTAEHRLY